MSEENSSRVTKEFTVKVTMESPSAEEAESDLAAWIRIKNQTSTQINGSVLTFERVAPQRSLIPTAFYPCESCCDEYTWPATDLYWSDKAQAWICCECWDDDSHGEKRASLQAHL